MAYIQLNPDGSGKRLDAATTASLGYYRQKFIAADPSLDLGMAPVDATLGMSVSANQAGVWSVNASITNLISALVSIQGSPAVSQGTPPWTVNASIQGTVPVSLSSVNVSVQGVPNVIGTVSPVGIYNNVVPSLLSLAAGSPDNLQLDQRANLLTNIATVSAPIPVSATIGTPSVIQGTNPWLVNASVIGQIPVSATVPTLVIGQMPAISVTATNTTVFQGGAPWLVSASVGTPTVNQGTSPWLVNASVVGIPNVNATYAAPWNVVASQGATPWLVNSSVVGTLPVFATVMTFSVGSILATVAQGSSPWTITGTTTPQAQYSVLGSSLASLAAGTYNSLQVDQVGNLITKLATITNLIPVQATTATLVIGLMPPIAVTATNTTIFQGGAPWTVNASVQGVPGVIATIANASIPVTESGAWNVTATVGNTVNVSESGAWNVTATINQGGTLTVQPGNTANTTPWLVNASLVGIQGGGGANQIKDDTIYGDAVNSGVLSVTDRLWNGSTYDRTRSVGGVLATTSNGIGILGAGMLGMYTSSIQTIASAATLSYYPPQLDINGNLRANLINSSVTVTQGTNPWLVSASVGTPTVNQGTNPWLVNASVIGNIPVTITVATIQVGSQNATVFQGNSPWTVLATVGAGNLSPTSVGGWKANLLNAAQSIVTISTAAGKFGGYMVMNTNSAPTYMLIFDTPAATVITIGVNTPTFAIPIPANTTSGNGVAANLELANGVAITNSLRVGFSTAITGAAAANPISGSIWYV